MFSVCRRRRKKGKISFMSMAASTAGRCPPFRRLSGKDRREQLSLESGQPAWMTLRLMTRLRICGTVINATAGAVNELTGLTG